MTDQENHVRRVETDEAIVALRNDHIVHVYYKPHTEITVELQHRMLEIFNELTGKKKHFFIFEAGEFCSVTSDARENAIQMEDKTPVGATAVVVGNYAQKLIADFYYRINKPKRPYIVVWKFNKGIEWLKNLQTEALPG